MKVYGVPAHLIWLVKALYDKAMGVVRVGGTTTDEFRFKKGVGQGCLISPLLFSLVGEKIMNEVEHGFQQRMGVVIGGREIWNIRYADDTTLLANSKSEIEALAESLRVESGKQGLIDD